MASVDKKLAQWKDAQVQCKLSEEAPVEEWIRDIYEKRHSKNCLW